MGFYLTENALSATLFQWLMDVLARFYIAIRDCRGQCYDGAPNKSGNVEGACNHSSQEKKVELCMFEKPKLYAYGITFK